MKEKCGWQNGMKLSLLARRASVCNITIVGFESGDTVERTLNSCIMHRHTGPVPGIMVWGCIGYYSRTPLVRIAGTLNSQCYISEVLKPVVLPYLQGLATAIFQQDNARLHVARILQMYFVNLPRLNCFPGRLTLRIFRR
ncbi:transposable element Tcb1 transposase [Trichonephila clavipes]|nr:transposable element Tcb1 transposase [Trichonephila clavipes]